MRTQLDCADDDDLIEEAISVDDSKSEAYENYAFVNVVRYCPTGTCLVSAGADGKIFVYDGENGETLGEVGSPAHKGGVYGAAFSKDGSRFVSASADKTLKLWRVDDLIIETAPSSCEDSGSDLLPDGRPSDMEYADDIELLPSA
ncbi:unnamed protein product [Echinostoma caproni]|uniref:WD_REPEATS_REGION domain-containing protein n=1 Tax=Echinostoma caproni TaxID=27848 RepID=A0A183BBU8_9TREM|nr:unnamed protein product [Echinostoma caproni]